MNQETIFGIAERLGLTIEEKTIPGHDSAFRVLKGVHQIFVGTADAVKEFFVTYEKERPRPFNESMIGYKE